MKNKTAETALKEALAQLEKSKSIIAKERDKIRETYYELETILESFDEGIESIESGKRDIESGIESLSQFV